VVSVYPIAGTDTTTPSYVENADAKPLGRSAMSVTGRVSNLFDRRYDEIATYAAPGRMILVGGRIDVGG